jgi:hypothetical protein
MPPMTLLAVASTMFLYVVVALCAMYAWQNHDWWLSVPLTLILGDMTPVRVTARDFAAVALVAIVCATFWAGFLALGWSIWWVMT